MVNIRRKTPAHTSRRFVASLAIAVLALAACGSDDESSEASGADGTTVDTADAPVEVDDTTVESATSVEPVDSGAATSGDGTFPVTIEHELGSATIESEPQRVVVLGDFNDLDSVLALGVTPVAFGFTDSWGTGLAPWQIEAGVEDLDQIDASVEISVEEVAAADPDVIIGMEYLAEPTYDQLSEVAPVVSLSFLNSWDEHLTTVAQALGKTDEADALRGQVDAALAAGTTELSAVADMPIMVGSYYGDQLYIQGEQSSVTTLLRDLGLTVLTTTDEQMDAQSLERVPLLADAEVILSLATDPAATTTAQDSALWQALPAVQAGRYTALTGSDARGMSDGFNALSYQHVIDVLVRIVNETAAGNGTPFSS